MIDASTEKYFITISKKLNLISIYYSEQLSGYFRHFSPNYVCARILSSLTEVLQRARRYDEAVELIQYLLGIILFIFNEIDFLI